MTAPIHLAYCVNRKMLTPLRVSIHSALSSLPADRTAVVWVFHMDLTADDLVTLRRTVEATCNDCALHVERLDVSHFRRLDGLHGEVIPFGKVLLPELLAGRARRVVYLDADTVVAGNLDELYDHDLEGRMLGAVSYETCGQALQADFFGEEGLDLSAKAFNSGVLLIDVEAWNAAGTTERAIRYIQANHHRYQGADQGALNVLFHGRFLPLRIRYNKRASAGTELEPADVQDGIIHFVGLPKPWDLGGRWAHKSYEVYARAQARSDVRADRPLDQIRRKGLARTAKGLWTAVGLLR